MSRSKLSVLEETFALQCKALKLPAFSREYQFLENRKFRLDFAWPSHKIAVEIHGAVHQQGRHTRGAGFERDREKMNLAVLEGWKVLELTGAHVTSGKGIQWLERLLGS